MVIILSREEVISKREGKISRSGHGAGVYLSKEELEKAGLDIGDEVEIEVTTDGKIVLKPKPVSHQKLLSDAIIGLIVGDAIEIGGAQIIPLYLPSEPEERDYVTIKEAIESGVVEIRDSGVIGSVIVNNTGDMNIFVAHGTVIAGGTQPRTVVTNALISPNRTVELPTRCVHDIRAISPHAKMKPIGFVPRQIAYGLTTAVEKINQHNVWHDVAYFMSSTSSSPSTVAPKFQALVNTTAKWRSSTDLSRAVEDLHNIAKWIMEEEKHVKKRKSGWRRYSEEW